MKAPASESRRKGNPSKTIGYVGPTPFTHEGHTDPIIDFNSDEWENKK
jgi:hypothetical protein